MEDLSLQCRCGQVRGAITDLRADRAQRMVCYCDDCQAFAKWIENEGGASFVDAHRGTDVLQVWPSQVKITDGIEHVKLMKLSEQGLLRWFTECCHTPAGNMLKSHRSPFVGLPTAIVRAPEGRTLDSAVGPPSAYIQGRFVVGGCPSHVHPKAPVSVITRSVRFLARGFVGGHYSPSPYFEANVPRVVARVLTKIERDALRPAG